MTGGKEGPVRGWWSPARHILQHVCHVFSAQNGTWPASQHARLCSILRLVGLSLYVDSLEQPNGTLASPLVNGYAPALAVLTVSLLLACLLPAAVACLVIRALPAKPASLALSAAVLGWLGAVGLVQSAGHGWGSAAWTLVLASFGAAASLGLWRRVGRTSGFSGGLPIAARPTVGASDVDAKKHDSHSDKSLSLAHLPQLVTGGANGHNGMGSPGNATPVSARRRSFVHAQADPGIAGEGDIYQGSFSRLRRHSSSTSSGGLPRMPTQGTAALQLPAWATAGWDLNSASNLRICAVGATALVLCGVSDAFTVTAGLVTRPAGAWSVLLPCVLVLLLAGAGAGGVVAPVAGAHAGRVALAAACLCVTGPVAATTLLLFAAPPVGGVFDSLALGGKLKMFVSGFSLWTGVSLLWPLARAWSQRTSVLGGAVGLVAAATTTLLLRLLCVASPYCLTEPGV